MTVISTMIVAAGCTNNNQQSEESNEMMVADSSGVVGGETDSIAGLPEQKDSIKAAKEYTNFKFPTATDAITFMQKSQDWAKYQEGILPQMAGENLGYASRLLNSPYKHFIVVDKDKMKVILFDRYGRVVHQYGMAGPRNYGTKHKKGDSRTPEGYFSAEGVYDSTDWEFTDDNGVKHPGKCFGPRFIRVKNPVTTQVGIHGTSSPGSIGRRTSHGCIRVFNENILQLVKYVEIGMPIIILPGPEDRAVNSREGHPTGYFNTGVERYAGAQTAPKKQTSKPAAIDSVAATSGSTEQPSVSAEEQPASEPEKMEPETPEQPQREE